MHGILAQIDINKLLGPLAAVGLGANMILFILIEAVGGWFLFYHLVPGKEKTYYTMIAAFIILCAAGIAVILKQYSGLSARQSDVVSLIIVPIIVCIAVVLLAQKGGKDQRGKGDNDRPDPPLNPQFGALPIGHNIGSRSAIVDVPSAKSTELLQEENVRVPNKTSWQRIESQLPQDSPPLREGGAAFDPQKYAESQRRIEIRELKSEFQRMEERFNLLGTTDVYGDGRKEPFYGRDFMKKIAQESPHGDSGSFERTVYLHLTGYGQEFAELKRILRQLGELRVKAIRAEASEVLKEVNEFYQTSFEPYVNTAIIPTYEREDRKQFESWKQLTAFFPELNTSGYRIKYTPSPDSVPKITLHRLSTSEIFTAGMIRIQIRTPATKKKFLLISLTVKNDRGEEFAYSVNRDEQGSLITPKWIEANGASESIGLYILALRLDHQANRLIRVIATFDEIGDVESNEESIPSNEITLS